MQRTVVAWQRTALSVVVAGTIVARVTFPRLDWAALLAVLMVLPLAWLLLLGARGKHGPTDVGRRGANGPVLAALSVGIAGLVLVELATIVRALLYV